MQVARIASGAELAYETAGTGEPVILIHGAVIADTFRPLIATQYLADRFGLILYRRRGYTGSSSASASVSVASEALDCRALLRYLGVARAHVVGHSYGGAVALQLALDAPEVVHSLALLEPALMAGASAQGYRDSLARSTDRFREAGAEVALEEFLGARWPDYRATLDQMLPGSFAQAVADARTSFEGEFPGLQGWTFGKKEACQIDQPTVTVLGGKSEAIWSRFGEIHRLLLEWLPHGEGVIVEGATHFMLIQNPNALAQALSDFWSRNPIQTTPR